MRLDEDMHIHSTFSDGKGSLRDNIDVAESLGLQRIGCVDHVRKDTEWLPLFVNAIKIEQRSTDVELVCGIEAKILNVKGELDIPVDISGVHRIYAADHQIPGQSNCINPKVVKEQLLNKEVTPGQVIADLLSGYLGCMRRYPGKIVIAHPFSILPKIGLSENDLTSQQLYRLGQCASATNSVFEISERWSCPNERAIKIFTECGATLWNSTDSHMPKKIGRYQFVKSQWNALVASTTPERFPSELLDE